MAELTITIPATISDGSVVKATDLEDVFGQIQTFQTAGGWCDDDNIKERSLVAANLADGLITSAKILDESLTGRVLTAGLVQSQHIADYAVRESKINWSIAAYMLVNAWAYPRRIELVRFMVGPYSFGVADTYVDVTLLASAALEGSGNLDIAAITPRQYTTVESFDIFYRVIPTPLSYSIRIVRPAAGISNTVYLEVMGIASAA